jgi:hypothetical protein
MYSIKSLNTSESLLRRHVLSAPNGGFDAGPGVLMHVGASYCQACTQHMVCNAQEQGDTSWYALMEPLLTSTTFGLSHTPSALDTC